MCFLFNLKVSHLFLPTWLSLSHPVLAISYWLTSSEFGHIFLKFFVQLQRLDSFKLETKPYQKILALNHVELTHCWSRILKWKSAPELQDCLLRVWKVSGPGEIRSLDYHHYAMKERAQIDYGRQWRYCSSPVQRMSVIREHIEAGNESYADH